MKLTLTLTSFANPTWTKHHASDPNDPHMQYKLIQCEQTEPIPDLRNSAPTPVISV